MTLTARQRELRQALRRDFLAEGFENFTIDGAVKRYHCSKSTLYALGNSRDNIIRAILVDFFKDITTQTKPRLDLPAPQALEQYFTDIAAALAPASPQFMRDCAREDVAQRVYSHNTKGAVENIRAMLDKGVKHGEFHASSLPFLPHLVQRAMEDIQRGIYQDTVSSAAAYAAFGELLIRGLTTPEARKI
ncbi:transcriptional regulator [Corynebacterium phocae]|uniref:Transcriptional regulator n=1 Tax=Corynebacterium phocae TaxID=161895 RepID=A0A1L7D3H6_9CORY|nr:TetR/AcrR family transcriptional regulator [Corynebacterium phocae]APT92655.1 transcriptional regulator [Corynebacterium phocae]KAA8723708.1 TetR/AcrR family transcriptional regulator [Corynebacterium phocae]